MTEAQYTRSINRLLPSVVYSWKINDRFTGGIPDAWYSGPGGDLWVEYKYVQKFGKTIKPNLSKLQTSWLNNRAKEKKDVAVIVGSPQGSIVFENSWDIKSTVPDTLLTKKEVAKYITEKVI